MFAETETGCEAGSVAGGELFTPHCTPRKNRRGITDCELGWESEEDEEGEEDDTTHPAIRSDRQMLYV